MTKNVTLSPSKKREADEEANLQGVIAMEEFVQDPKSGIPKSSQMPILQLIHHVFLGMPADESVLRKWEILGRYDSKNGQIALQRPEAPWIELCLMSLEWEGKVEFVPVVGGAKK